MRLNPYLLYPLFLYCKNVPPVNLIALLSFLAETIFGNGTKSSLLIQDLHISQLVPSYSALHLQKCLFKFAMQIPLLRQGFLDSGHGRPSYGSILKPHPLALAGANVQIGILAEIGNGCPLIVIF